MSLSKSKLYPIILITILLALALLSCSFDVFAGSHLRKEKDYQASWCNEHGGIQEYVLDDRARVDCLLPGYAVEFDFASKWAESAGQALYYGLKTGRQAGVVLIMENPRQEAKYLKRLKTIAEQYGIAVWTMTGL